MYEPEGTRPPLRIAILGSGAGTTAARIMDAAGAMCRTHSERLTRPHWSR